MSEYAVPIDEALKSLDIEPDYDAGSGPGECVHTFKDAGPILIGAHWYLSDLLVMMEEHGVERSGDAATKANHGLVILHPKGPLFLATHTPKIGEPA